MRLSIFSIYSSLTNFVFLLFFWPFSSSLSQFLLFFSPIFFFFFGYDRQSRPQGNRVNRMQNDKRGLTWRTLESFEVEWLTGRLLGWLWNGSSSSQFIWGTMVVRRPMDHQSVIEDYSECCRKTASIWWQSLFMVIKVIIGLVAGVRHWYISRQYFQKKKTKKNIYTTIYIYNTTIPNNQK